MTSQPDAAHGADPTDSSWFAGQEAVAAAAARDATRRDGGGSAGMRDGGSADMRDGGTAATGATSFPAERDPMFDPEWNPPRRFNRLTAVLVAGLVAAGAFAGGAALQRSHDAGLVTTSQSRTSRTGGIGGAGGFGGAGSFPSGGFGGGAGSTAGAGSSAGPGSGAGPSSGSAADVPVVVGTVVSINASTVTVKNFAGATVVVHLPVTATITVTGATALQPGASVAVHGTKAADGSVTATALISRKPAG